MAFRDISREMYDLMLDAFREQPGNASHAARTAGCDRRMALRGWKYGWTERFTWAQPIMGVLEDERAQARVDALKLQQAEKHRQAQDREVARKEAIEARAQQGKIAQLARMNAFGLLTYQVALVRGAVKLGERLRTELETVDMTADQASKLLHRIASMGKHITETARHAAALERERFGDAAKELFGDVGLEQLGVAEAVREIEEAASLLELAKQRGLVVLDGGLGNGHDSDVSESQDEGSADDDGNSGNGHGAA